MAKKATKKEETGAETTEGMSEKEKAALRSKEYAAKKRLEKIEAQIMSLTPKQKKEYYALTDEKLQKSYLRKNANKTETSAGKPTSDIMTDKLLAFFNKNSPKSEKEKAKFLGLKPKDYTNRVMKALETLALGQLD